jgi:hypothetical protein
MGEKREGVVGNSEACSPWRERDGKRSSGGQPWRLARPARAAALGDSPVTRGGGECAARDPRTPGGIAVLQKNSTSLANRDRGTSGDARLVDGRRHKGRRG